MITINEELYNKMPDDLRVMFNKLPNYGSEEVLSHFPNANGQQGDLVGHNHNIESPNGIFGIMPPRYDAYKREENDKSASRFFYCAKSSKSERNKGLEANNHPTVKPVSLMRYLCRLITPPKGIVLDPFMGSGSTGIGAKLEGFDFVGIEREDEYCKIAKARIDAWEVEVPAKVIIEPTLF